MGRAASLAALAAFAATYAGAFAYWTLVRGEPAGEVPLLGALFIVVFPLVAWLVTLRSKPLGPRVTHDPAAPFALFVCLALVVGFIALGSSRIFGFIWSGATAEPLFGWFNVALKLAVFVAVPFLLFGVLMGSPASSFGWHRPVERMLGPRQLVVLVVFAAMFLVVQLYAGREGARVLSGVYAPGELALGFSLAFVWLSIEAGLVEEVFFRAALQERLAAWLRSDIAGLIYANLIFGLAHAPGLWLRGEFADQGFAAAAAYSVLTLAPAGFVFGVIWLRTRNLLVLVLSHGLLDAIPHMAEAAGRFGFSIGH